MKIKDAVVEKDNLQVLKGRTGVVIITRSEAFEAKGGSQPFAKSTLVFRKGEIAKLHRYLGKVLKQMEEVD